MPELDFAPGIEKAFIGTFEEGDKSLSLQGKVPTELSGDYYLLCPGRFDASPQAHWLDGDGLLFHLRLDSGQAKARTQYVRTEKYLDSSTSPKAFRGFARSGGQLSRHHALATPANVAVRFHADQLLAFGEHAIPYALNPATLETLGEFDFQGQLAGWHPMGAHLKQDPRTGELYSFGLNYTPSGTELLLYRFDRKQRLIYKKAHPLPAAHYIHDFLISGRFCIFHLSPYYFQLDRFVQGASFLESLNWTPTKPSELWIYERITGKFLGQLPVGPGFSVHTINAFDEGDTLFVDFVEFTRPFYDELFLKRLFADVPHGRPVRAKIKVPACTLESRNELAYDNGPDFPHVAARSVGQRYEEFWALGISNTGRSGKKFYDELLCFDWEHGTKQRFSQAEEFYCGEPCALNDRWLLCQSFRPKTGLCTFQLFEARQVQNGPVASFTLKQALPLGLHCTFIPS
ncbi:MAG: carotenoid oxygenase family protein [Bdellovibrionales bacterium]|nr:carotenoid oxygenase family protein [Bdellovibrionales bacterium]